MATAGQIIFTKLTAPVLAIVAALWWHSEGFGWLTTIAAGIVAYIFWKIMITLAIGLIQGWGIRAEIKAETDALRRSERERH